MKNETLNSAPPSETLEGLRREGEHVASVLSEAFEAAGDTISNALDGAARSGALSFSEMTESILQDLAKLALEQVLLDPLEAWSQRLTTQLSGLDFGVIGQRAEGGPVLSGQRYLVGERGPEVFTASTGGAVQPVAPVPSVKVIIQSPSPTSLDRRSERQIAAAIARAARRGSSML